MFWIVYLPEITLSDGTTIEECENYVRYEDDPSRLSERVEFEPVL